MDLAAARTACDPSGDDAMDVPVTDTHACCGRARAEDCRCYTEAEQLAAAVRAFVARRVRAPHDVDDITQETLLRMYRGAHDLRDEPALEGWMFRIARTAIIDHHRRAAVRPTPADPGDLDLQAGEDAEPPRHDAMLAECLSDMMARIPDSYRAALELTDLGGMTQEEGAARLGLSTSGMKSRVQRGRRMLRQEVVRCCRVELDARGALSDADRRDPGGC